MKTLSRQRGFTLIELTIAIAIFAIISVVAFGSLQTTIATRDQVRAHSDRLQRLQRTFLIMQQDFIQASNRTIRDQLGDRRPAMLTELGMLEFTRDGHVNPLNLPRSTLQRVAYRLEDGQLQRLQWQTLDWPHDPKHHATDLLDEVDSLSFRFLDHNKEWVETWPPAGAGGLPRAVEVRLELADLGEIQRMFLVSF